MAHATHDTSAAVTRGREGADVVEIDGSAGEGGGQVLRSSLSLSILTGRPFHIRDIRAQRKKPGLLRQHLAAVRAAARVGAAHVEGAALGARELTFHPGAVTHGVVELAVGSAGSAMLVLQTALPPLVVSRGRSRLVLEGGTHNPLAPPFDFIARSFAPVLARMGASLTCTLERHGFHPAGGGRVVVDVEGAPLAPLELLSRGRLVRRRAEAIVANLTRHIAERELKVVEEELGFRGEELVAREVESEGPGNALLLTFEYENVVEVITAFGERGLSAERVAASAVRDANAYLAHDAPVGEHLADQLLLPLAIAGGAIRTGPLSLHARTNLEVIRRFLPELRLEVQDAGGFTTVVRADRAGFPRDRGNL